MDSWTNARFATAEVLAFGAALSPEDEARVGLYLAEKYGISTSYTGAGFGAVVAGDLDMSTTNVIVTDASTLSVPTLADATFDGDVTLGSLTFGDGATTGALTVTGAEGTVSFSGTSINGTFSSIDMVTESNVNPGGINFGNATIDFVKTGDADLIIDTPITGTAGTPTFDVQAGRLVAVHGGSNPIAGSDVDINGGEVVLVSSGVGTHVAFNNQFETLGTGGTLTAGRTGDGFGPLDVAVNNLTLTAGSFTLQTFDSNTLVLPNGLSSAGGVTIAGDVEVDTVFNVDALTVVSGGTITPTSGGTLANITVGSDLTLDGGDLNLLTAGLTLNTTAATDMTVENGSTLTFNQLTSSVNNLTVNDGSMIGHASDTTVTLAGNLSLTDATLIRILFGGTGGVTVNTAPDPDGYVDLGAGHTYSGDTVIDYGALVIPTASDLSPNSNLRLSADDADVAAVLATTGTFNRAIGTGAGQFQWEANGGGFAAKGGALDVNIGGAAASIGWTTDTGAGIIGNGNVLQLGHTGVADGLVKILNPINLDGAERTVLAVDNGASNTDMSELAGNLTNGDLKKDGDGTVRVTGAATVLGATNIHRGAVRIADGSFANLGTISLTGNTNIDDDAGIQTNHQIGVIETERVLPLFVNPAVGTDPAITFQNSSVGLSNSSAVNPLLVAVGGDATSETEAAARTRTIVWNTDLNNKRIVMGSATAQGPTELINLLDLGGWGVNEDVFLVADNPNVTTDKAIVNLLTTSSIRGIRKGGAGELVVNTRDAAGALAVLGINNHDFEVDEGTVTVAAGSTLRFHGGNERNFRIEDGARVVNQGEIVIDMNNGGDRELRFYGAGELVNEGTFTFGGTTAAAFNRLEFESEHGTFRNTPTGTIDILAGRDGYFWTENNANTVGSKVINEAGATISIVGNRDLYFQRYIALEDQGGTSEA